MGCCITKRQRPALPCCGYCEATTCDCQGSCRNTRTDIFRRLENSLSGGQPLYVEPYLISELFMSIFFLKNSKCNITCCDKWIKSENLSEREKQLSKNSLPNFAERFITLEEFRFVHYERMILSALVLFRTELAPAFNEILDENDYMHPFLMRMIHLEGIIRKRLCSKKDNDFYDRNVHISDEERVQNLHFLRAGHISESIKSTHKWWNEDFVDSPELNVIGEYDLTD